MRVVVCVETNKGTGFNDACASMFEVGIWVGPVIMTHEVVESDRWTALAFNDICSVAIAAVIEVVT